MVKKRLGCKWSGFWSPTIWNSDKCRHLVKNKKCLDFEWSGFRMVGTIAIAIAIAEQFEIRPCKIPPSNGLISDPHCIILQLNNKLFLFFNNSDPNFIQKNLVPDGKSPTKNMLHIITAKNLFAVVLTCHHCRPPNATHLKKITCGTFFTQMPPILITFDCSTIVGSSVLEALSFPHLVWDSSWTCADSSAFSAAETAASCATLAACPCDLIRSVRHTVSRSS